MLVDSHCHLDQLDLASYEGSLDLALTAARAQNIGHFLCIGLDRHNSPKVIEIAAQYPDVSASIGVHPTEPCEIDMSLEELISLGSHAKVVAIGETGLDYYRLDVNHPEEFAAAKSLQQTRFRHHIQASRALQKPLIVHTREARADTLSILQEEKAEEIGGVLHCFTENLEMAEAAMELNFYISFSGIITFRNAQALQEVARKIPLSRILIETDAPYLAPVPYRGKPNQPAYVHYVAEALAALRDDTFENIAKATTENFFRLFQHANRSAYVAGTVQ